MCRWLAHSGTPVLLEELLYREGQDETVHAAAAPVVKLTVSAHS